jgi:hypothetical protein
MSKNICGLLVIFVMTLNFSGNLYSETSNINEVTSDARFYDEMIYNGIGKIV